jgi:hypothetical protein
MLSNGNDKVPPISSMWPLVCNEVALSYDQEERLRSYQRSVVLPDENTWLHRHTARASDLAVQSVHDGLGSVLSTLAQREESAKSILTAEQRVKFLSWAAKNEGRISARFEEKRQQAASSLYHVPVSDDSMNDNPAKTGYYLMQDQHIASNLYILNHRLQTSVLRQFPYQGLGITTAALRKLSRRPSFESLGQRKDAEGKLLKRDDSFCSSGSLSMMNSVSTPSLAGMDDQSSAQQHQTTHLAPEEAEKTAEATVEQVLGHVKEIIPPIPPPVAQEYLMCNVPMSDAQPQPVQSSVQPIDHYHHGYGNVLDPSQYPAPTPVLSMSASAPAFHSTQPHYEITTAPAQVMVQPSQTTYSQTYHQAQPGPQYAQQIQPQTQVVYTTQAIVQPGQMVVVPVPSIAPSAPQQAPPPANHVRTSSFLPPHLNVVPEDMFATGDVSEEDFFVGLMEDDWAIGGGMDLSSD